jgi:hypothetical protein
MGIVGARCIVPQRVILERIRGFVVSHDIGARCIVPQRVILARIRGFVVSHDIGARCIVPLRYIWQELGVFFFIFLYLDE